MGDPTFRDAQSISSKTASISPSQQKPCSACGHCPCCGRGRSYPVYPNQWYPPYQYPSYPYVTYGGSAGSASAAAPKTGTYQINLAATTSASAEKPNGATLYGFTA